MDANHDPPEARFSPVRLQRVTPQEAGLRLDRFLGDHLAGAPISLLQRLMRTGQVRVNGGRARGGSRLCAGDEVRLPPVRIVEEGSRTAPRSPPVPLLQAVRDGILWRDDHLLILNKPSGLMVHAGSGGRWGAVDLLRAVLAGEGVQPELCHRLDRDTSGCLLFALNKSAVRRLTAAFRAGQVEKTYLALVRGRPHPEAGVIDRPLVKGVVRGGERMVVTAAEGGVGAVTHYRVRERFRSASLVEVRPATGRTHQIRAHFQWFGAPLAGDGKYGDRIFDRALKRFGLNRLFLHAAGLAFTHPEHGERLAVAAPLEPSLEQVLARMRREGGA